MKRKTKMIAVAGSAAAIVLSGAGIAYGVSAGDDPDPGETDTVITGDALAQASAAALAHTGQGTVTGSEVGDEESYYEIEVTLDNGDQVDVQLDESFVVVDTIADSENDK
jgi:hypothetical protein